MRVCRTKTQIRLGGSPVLSEYSLCTKFITMDPSFLDADSEYSDQFSKLMHSLSESSRD